MTDAVVGNFVGSILMGVGSNMRNCRKMTHINVILQVPNAIRIVVFVTVAHFWTFVCRICIQLHFSDRLLSSVRPTASHHQHHHLQYLHHPHRHCRHYLQHHRSRQIIIINIIPIFIILSIFFIISPSCSSSSTRALPEGCRPQALLAWASILRLQVQQSSGALAAC